MIYIFTYKGWVGQGQVRARKGYQGCVALEFMPLCREITRGLSLSLSLSQFRVHWIEDLLNGFMDCIHG